MIKKILSTISIIPVLWSGLIPFTTYSQQISDPEFDQGLQRAYSQGMTKYSTQEEYRPMSNLTREEGAKLFGVFIQKNLCGEKIVPISDCEFKDSSQIDPTLIEYVQLSCQLGILKGSNDYFLPKEPLTKAQALTILIRGIALKGDESMSPRRQRYYDHSFTLGLTKEPSSTGLDRPLTRYESLLLQYRTRTYECKHNEQLTIEQKLEGILQ